TFLSFQWDNLLLECGALASLLPGDRSDPPARVVHVLFRLLLWKLYFESGIAKWQSHLGDWIDGSAMLHYYETAPLPTLLGWFSPSSCWTTRTSLPPRAGSAESSPASTPPLRRRPSLRRRGRGSVSPPLAPPPPSSHSPLR